MCMTQIDSAFLNMRKLKRLLMKFGEYPETYRTLVWRFILCLPENREQFDGLLRRGVHPAMKDLAKKYPIQNRTLFRRLEKSVHRVFSALLDAGAQLIVFVRWFAGQGDVGTLPYVGGLHSRRLFA